MRPSGGGVAKSRAGQPPDPRTEGSNTNGSTNGKAKGVGSLGGRLAAQAKKQAARNPRKRAGLGAADAARTHTPPTAVEASAPVLEGPVLGASAPMGERLTAVLHGLRPVARRLGLAGLQEVPRGQARAERLARLTRGTARKLLVEQEEGQQIAIAE